MENNPYEFLEHFDKRMNTVGAICSFVVKIINTQRFKDILNQNEMINLSVSVLCFLLEKTLDREGATLLDLKDFIRYVVVDCFKKQLDEEDCLSLARFLIRDIFMNSGEMFSFDVFKFDVNTFEPKKIRLIQDKQLKDNAPLKYELTEFGSEFLLRTKEIDSHLQFSMQQIVTKEFIKRKDFKGATLVAKDMLNTIHIKRQVVESFIYRVQTTNILNVEKSEYKKQVDDIFNTLEEQKKEFDNIIVVLNEAEKDFINLGLYDSKIDDYQIVRELLNEIRKEHNNLFEQRYIADQTYEDAINNAMLIGLTKRFDFSDTILRAVEEEPILLESAYKVLRPLFNIEDNKVLNLMKVYEPQQILTETDYEDEETEVLIIEEDIKATEEKANLIKRVNKNFYQFLKAILDTCIDSENNTASFQQIYNKLPLSDINTLIAEDDRQSFVKVVLTLYNKGECEIHKVLKECTIIHNLDFNIANTFRDLCNNDTKYTKIKTIETYIDDPKDNLDIVAEKEFIEENTTKLLTRMFQLTNFKFKVVLYE